MTTTTRIEIIDKFFFWPRGSTLLFFYLSLLWSSAVKSTTERHEVEEGERWDEMTKRSIIKFILIRYALHSLNRSVDSRNSWTCRWFMLAVHQQLVMVMFGVDGDPDRRNSSMLGTVKSVRTSHKSLNVLRSKMKSFKLFILFKYLSHVHRFYSWVV